MPLLDCQDVNDSVKDFVSPGIPTFRVADESRFFHHARMSCKIVDLYKGRRSATVLPGNRLETAKW